MRAKFKLKISEYGSNRKIHSCKFNDFDEMADITRSLKKKFNGGK